MAVRYDDSKLEDALNALLHNITQAASQGNAASANNLAEAFAWLISPSQSHSGGVKPKS